MRYDINECDRGQLEMFKLNSINSKTPVNERTSLGWIILCILFCNSWASYILISNQYYVSAVIFHIKIKT